MSAGTSRLFSPLDKTMKSTAQEVIYRGVWPGLGKMYNIKAGNGYTTIIVKPGDDLNQRSKEAKDKFTSQEDLRQMYAVSTDSARIA
jgi:hypothetical protein